MPPRAAGSAAGPGQRAPRSSVRACQELMHAQQVAKEARAWGSVAGGALRPILRPPIEAAAPPRPAPAPPRCSPPRRPLVRPAPPRPGGLVHVCVVQLTEGTRAFPLFTHGGALFCFGRGRKKRGEQKNQVWGWCGRKRLLTNRKGERHAHPVGSPRPPAAPPLQILPPRPTSVTARPAGWPTPSVGHAVKGWGAIEKRRAPPFFVLSAPLARLPRPSLTRRPPPPAQNHTPTHTNTPASPVPQHACPPPPLQ